MVRMLSRRGLEPERFEHRGQVKRMTWLSGKEGGADPGPEVFYSETLGPGATTKAHFHRVDQFQVFLEGAQRLGRSPLPPITLHYADAHTPYGPIVGDDTGVHYLTYRARRDPGALFMPESRPLRRHLGGRHASVRVPVDPPTEPPRWRTLIEPHPDGLSAEVAEAASSATLASRGPAGGAGRAYVVVRGSMRWDGEDHPVLSSLFSGPGDDPGPLSAGPSGMTILALGYPSIDGARPNAGS